MQADGKMEGRRELDGRDRCSRKVGGGVEEERFGRGLERQENREAGILIRKIEVGRERKYALVWDEEMVR